LPRNPANDIDDVVTERLSALVGLASVVTRLAARVERLEQNLEILRRGDPDQLLDTEQAAQLLGMSEAAVRQAARRGRLPAEYRGRSLRFRRGALLASPGIQRRKHRPAAGAANPNT
jgi:excisionase family DNA binding protein